MVFYSVASSRPFTSWPFKLRIPPSFSQLSIVIQLPVEKQNGHETEEELRAQIAGLKQSLKQYEDMIGQYQVSEQTRKREVDSALITAKEVVLRERREKLDVLSDRKSREEQFEQLSKAMSLMQV